MRALLAEYGRYILAVLIALIIFPFIIWIARTQFNTAYQEPEKESLVNYSETSALADPVMVVDDITITKGDAAYNAKPYLADKNGSGYKTVYKNYQKLATCYESSRNETALPPESVEVIGIDEVDVTKKGIYKLLYRVVNSKGLQFQKVVYAIVN